MKISTVLKLSAIGISLSLAQASYATTLTDALIQAYQTNPSLRVGQSALRATDENARQATGALLPSVTANISANRTFNETTNTETPNNSASVRANLPIYAGKTRLLAIEQSHFNVLATRQALIATEQNVLLSAVTAYMDVRRDQRNVELAINSVRVLTEEVRAARERFEVGEVTRTDVSQAESRLAASEGTLQSSRAALKRSMSSYTAAVGSAPKDLRTPPAAPKLPKTANEAEAIAVSRHPNILQAQFELRAAEKQVQIARGNKLPVISGNVTASRSNGGSNFAITTNDQDTVSVGVNLDQTLYQGGILNSQEREARAIMDQENAELQLAGVQIRENVQSSYATWLASMANIEARQKQVRAAKIAFEGVSEEAKLGARTTLDALDAEQELLSARTDLASAIRDEYVNAYAVLSAMGLLTVDHLNLGIESYNPDTHYSKVNGKNKLGTRRLSIFEKLQKRNGSF